MRLLRHRHGDDRRGAARAASPNATLRGSARRRSPATCAAAARTSAILRAMMRASRKAPRHEQVPRMRERHVPAPAASSCRRPARSSSASRFAGDGVAQRLPAADAALGKTLDTNEVDGFIAVNADGTVTIFCGKVDLGQGLRIAIPQMAAEELGIGVERIVMIEGDTALTPDQGPTAGSSGIMRGGVQIRQAAATAREALIGLAAARAGTPGRRIRRASTARCGRRPAAQGIRFGELVGDKRFGLKVDPKAPLRDPAHVHGRRQAARAPRRSRQGHRPARLRARLQGRRHAARPRACGRRAVGAKLVAVDESSIKDIPGARVVRINDFVGVVADERMGRRSPRREAAEGALVGSSAADRQRRACAAWMRAGPFESDEIAGEEGRRQRGARGRREAHRGGVLLADAVARLDGAVVRGRRRARRQGDDLERVAGHAPLPRDDRARARRCRRKRCASSISTAPAATA